MTSSTSVLATTTQGWGPHGTCKRCSSQHRVCQVRGTRSGAASGCAVLMFKNVVRTLPEQGMTARTQQVTNMMPGPTCPCLLVPPTDKQFVANRWLATDEGDNQTYCVLYPSGEGATPQPKKYRIMVSA